LCAKWMRKILCKNVLTLHRYRDFRVGLLYCDSLEIVFSIKLWSLRIAISFLTEVLGEFAADGLTENDGHEIDGHEIGGQDMYRLKIDYIRMQCVFLLTWATMKDTVIVAIESNSFEFTL